MLILRLLGGGSLGVLRRHDQVFVYLSPSVVLTGQGIAVYVWE